MFNKKNKNKLVMNKLFQCTLQQRYVQQTKPHLYLRTVQSTTKEHVYTFNPPYSTCTPYMQYLRITHDLYVTQSLSPIRFLEEVQPHVNRTSQTRADSQRCTDSRKQ